MSELVTLGLFSPLVSALVLVFLSGHLSHRGATLLASAAVLTSFFCFAAIFFGFSQGLSEPMSIFMFHWIPSGNINADFTLYLDSLSLLMTLIICGIGFLIHVYASGYIEDDEKYARFFAAMNFFIFAMLLLVLAQNLLLLFVGWEGVGLASYLLIGFWYDRNSAAAAASKAFIVNRAGDVGLLLALLLAIYLFGSTDIPYIAGQLKGNFSSGDPAITALATFLFIGACGKSAQLPLHIWLADAMEGPTPVSALIHAATMVTAGVYLVVRMHPVYLMAPDVLYAIGWIGSATAIFGALCAMGQSELKKVLAYSTISQLGLMFVACGSGSFYAAMFHLTTHAFVKALLFLSAGNVVHMLHGIKDMGAMGGLGKKLPITQVFFFIGVLALSGIPPLALFFSKDLIIEEAYRTGNYVFAYATAACALLTAFYLTRAFFLTFRGPPNTSPLHAHVSEAPQIMIIPTGILAILAVIGGFIGVSFGTGDISFLERLLAPSLLQLAASGIELSSHYSLPIVLSIAGAILGITVPAYVYSRQEETLADSNILLKNAFYVDRFIAAFIVAPLVFVANVITYVGEVKIFQFSLNLAAVSVYRGAGVLQQLQSGYIRNYIAGFTIGSALLILYFIV